MQALPYALYKNLNIHANYNIIINMANHSKQTGVKARSSYKSLLSSKQEERTGGKSRKALRDERDVERRVAACYAKRKAYKDIPKEKRELSRRLSVAQKANERNFLTLYAESVEDEEIVVQSGGAVLKGVLGGGAALTAWLLSKGMFDIGSASKQVANAVASMPGFDRTARQQRRSKHNWRRKLCSRCITQASRLS
jgi:hypothetical protein